MAPQAKKNKGMVPLQTQRAKILRFHHSSHLGDLGVGRGAPKSAQKSLFFFFFFPQKSRIMRCRIIRYMELFPWLLLQGFILKKHFKILPGLPGLAKKWSKNFFRLRRTCPGKPLKLLHSLAYCISSHVPHLCGISKFFNKLRLKLHILQPNYVMGGLQSGAAGARYATFFLSPCCMLPFPSAFDQLSRVLAVTGSLCS